MKKYANDLKDIFRFSLSSMTVIGLFLLLMIVDVNFWAAFLISMAVGSYLFYQQDKRNVGRQIKKKRLKKLSPQKEAFYQSKGLTKDEIRFFRETMQTAKIQILQIDKNFQT